jgi:hypothetical protein
VIDTEGKPVGWDTTAPVPYFADQGNLGMLSNREAVRSVRTFFRAWQDVPTATIRFQQSSTLPIDVDVTNFGPYLGPYGAATEPLGMSAVVFDADGSIFDALYGVGTGVVGFAGPTWFTDGTVAVPIGAPVPPGSRMIEGLAFLNGKFQDGIDDPASGNYELAREVFDTVFIHEFGHFAGLDHTQIHGMCSPPESDSWEWTQPVETMFPYLVDAGQLALGRDDVVALSALYPTGKFVRGTGRIAGRVMLEEGTLLSGVNVIARNVADDGDAVSFVSGATLVTPGAFTLVGLTPGQSYRVEIQQIDAAFAGGSRVGPYDPQPILPGPPESWSGASESADPQVDDPASFEAVVAQAGVTVSDVDVVLNRQPFGVANVSLQEPNGQIQDFAAGDFDRDGTVDFVTVQSGFTPGNLVRFHRGLGGGTFAAPVLVEQFNGNEWVEAAQLDSGIDGFLDIAVAGLSGQVRLYRGNGDGTFAPPATILTHPSPFDIRGFLARDLDGDPFPDLFVLVEDWDTGATVYTLLGSASGTFTTLAMDLDPGSCVPIGGVSIAQIAGSPDLDVIGTCQDAAGHHLALWTGDGTGRFTVLPPFALSPITSSMGGSLGLGDFDENGTTDVVFNDQKPVGLPPNWTRSWIDLLLGDGSGGFTFSRRYWVAEPGQGGIVVADLDRDGHLDVLSSGANYWYRSPGAKVNLVLGDGDGGFSGVTSIWGLAESPESMLPVDLDGDGGIDILLSTSESSWEGPYYQGNYSVLMNRIETQP